MWWDASVLWGQYLHHRHHDLQIKHLVLGCVFYRLLRQLCFTLWIGCYSGRKTMLSMLVQWELKGFQDCPSRKRSGLMSSSEELSQRLEKRFHCACDFHASFNFSDFQLPEKYSRKFARFFVRMLALLALTWSKAAKLLPDFIAWSSRESAAFWLDLWNHLRVGWSCEAIWILG